MSMPNKVWRPEVKDRLCELWGTMSAEKIGIELFGVTGKKNSVVGAAHRMGLQKIIASPNNLRKPVNKSARATAQREYERRKREFKKAGEPWRTCERRALAAALPALESLRAIADEPFKHEVVVVPTPTKQKVVPRSASVVLGAMHQCCWPIGDPGTPGFKFCCEPVDEVGKSYCEVHRKIAYQPKQRERVW